MFIIGTFWFWTLMVVEFIFLIILLEKEEYIAAPFTIIGTVVLLILFGSGMGDLFPWIIQNPVKTLGCVVGYFAFGTLYASLPHFGKWWWFVRDVRDHNRDKRKEWLGDWKNNSDRLKRNADDWKTTINKYEETNDNRLADVKEKVAKLLEESSILENSNGTMTEGMLPLWKEVEESFIYSDWFGRRIGITKPEPEQFKNRIISWIVYWPPSLFWTLLNDPLRRIGQLIYEAVTKSLKSISDSAWRDEDKTI